MKKFFVMMALAATTLAASAQEPAKGFYGNKFGDNWYVGLNGGVATKTTHQALLKNLNPNLGLRVGKWFTPYFGVAVEGELLFGNKVMGHNYTSASGVKAIQAMLLGQFNLSNAFYGYKGEPRSFEVIANLGIGPLHNYLGDKEEKGTIENTLNQKIALDFAWNFGKQKQWQFYVEPAITYSIAGAKSDGELDEKGHGRQTVGYDINYSNLQLNVGINYRFRTSTGTHNFVDVVECDQNEIDALNASINDLRNKNVSDQDQIARLKAEIEALRKALKDCEDKPVVVEKQVDPNLPAIFYQVNKSIITPAQQENVKIAGQLLKNHPELKIIVKGYASPEGPHDNNNDLSVRRAEAVKDMLVKKFNIDPSRISTEGCGETDQLFEIYEFNRVAMLYLDK